MDVSVVVTCYNEENNIRECLSSLVNQTYAAGEYEVVVADGGSKDDTQRIVKEFERRHPNVRLVIEPKKGTAVGRNAGVKASRYDYVAFIDADCEAPADWLTILVKHYLEIFAKDQKVVAVGGSNIPPKNASTFVRAIGVALDSYIGSFGSVQGRRFRAPRYVSSLSNLNVLYSKKRLAEVGYYDESLASEAEDADMNFRLYSSGHRFLFIPGSFVWHKMRPTPMTWLKNMFRYGKGRARLLKRYPQMWALSFVLPIVFILSIGSILFAPLFKIFYLPALYFQIIKKHTPTLVFHVMFVYLIQHFGYAAGEVYGLLHPQIR